MARSVSATHFAQTILSRIQTIAAWLQGLRGWKRLLAAAGFGGLTALAFGPFYLWPALFVSFTALIWLIDGTTGWKQAAIVAWAFGFGYFLIGLHWVGFAFVVDVARHGWLLPFVAVIFPGGLALFYAATGALARRFWMRGPLRVVTFAVALCLFEWLRGHVLTGFPWNLPAAIWDGWDAMFQTASLWGVYGLSFLTTLLAAAPAALVDASGSVSRLRWPIFGALGLFVALLVFGCLRLPTSPAPVFDDVALRIVQPNVPQAEKWKEELLQRNWTLLLDLTRQPGLDTRTHVIWPEAAPPFLMLSEPAAFQIIAEILPDKTKLITGVARMEGPEDKRRYYNSMTALTGDGRVLAVYDKSHLVPFGEYLPLFQILEPLGVTKITGGREGYSEGPGVRTLTIPDTPPFGPLICYEVIFPSAVVEAGNRPQWLTVLTDDSWFGPWTGPYQHLGIAKVRAAEEGLAIVRAANTGVSAIIDPYGRIVTSLGLDRTGILDAQLPKPLEATFFSRFGDLLFALMLMAGASVSLIFLRSSSQDC